MMEHLVIGKFPRYPFDPRILRKYIVAEQVDIVVNVVRLHDMLWKFQNAIGLPKGPLLRGPVDRRRQIVRIPPGRTVIDPRRNRFDLLGCEPGVVHPLANWARGVKGRHRTRKHFTFDRLRPGTRLFVRQ